MYTLTCPTLTGLPPAIRDELLSCISIKRFKDQQFARLIRQHRLDDQHDVIRDELYVAVVGVDIEQRRESRRAKRAKWQSAPPGMN